MLFPTQHSLALIDAAQSGQSMLQAQLYDGSEKGQKVYETTAIIGKQIAPGADPKIEAMAKDKGLGELVSWPVSIGYFEPKGGDLTPSYQIDFRLYANGVSRELLIDYGDFSIHGTLTSLEYFKAEACPQARPSAAELVPIGPGNKRLDCQPKIPFPQLCYLKILVTGLR